MKKQSLLGIFILTFCLSSIAQINDKKSASILEEVSNKTKSYKNIKIEFSYKIENKAEKINESKDGVIFIKGDKYNIDISGQNVVSDGKTIWTYIKEADEIHINNVNPQEESLNLNMLLSNYNKDFRSKLIREETHNKDVVYIIDLMPIKGKSYHRVRLNISKSKLQILNASIFDKNGSTFSYEVKKMSYDLPLKDDFFTLKTSAYPKAEVIDMR